MFRKQVKYDFIIKNENDSFVNLLFFAELASKLDQAIRFALFIIIIIWLVFVADITRALIG